MAQYVTLEEAAQRLGIPADEFKRRLKTEWTHVVPMRDGPTLRFRVNQVDELARQLGAASDPALPLAEPLPVTPGSDDFRVPTDPGTADEPLLFDGSDDDVFALTDDPAGGKKGKSSGDSDVRLEVPGRKARPPENVPTEEVSLDLAGGPGSAVIKGGSGAKLTPPKSGAKLSAPDSGKKLSGGLSNDGAKNLAGPGGTGGDSSEFELSLDADSDDFELRLNTDSSDEVDLGSSPVEAGGPGKSGVNLRDPDDSGIPLDAGKKKGAASPSAQTDSDSDLDFELTLDPAGPASGPRLTGGGGGPKSGGRAAPVTSDSDSEFELTLDGSSGSGSSLEAAALESAEANKGDIFETDFEIPPMAEDSGSEAVAVDADTDLEDDAVASALDDPDATDETGSQVVEIEDDADAVTPVVELGEDDDAPASSPRLRGRDDADLAPAAAAVALKPAPWGVLPALILFPTVVFTLLGGLMALELLRTMNGYAQPKKPAAPLVRALAENLDMKPADQ